MTRDIIRDDREIIAQLVISPVQAAHLRAWNLFGVELGMRHGHDLKALPLTTPCFGGLSDASVDLLIPLLAEGRFDAGATIVAEDEPGRSLFILHAGELVVSKRGDSEHEIRLASLGPGDFFGEMTLIEMQNRSATVVARARSCSTSSRPESSTPATRPTSTPM